MKRIDCVIERIRAIQSKLGVNDASMDSTIIIESDFEKLIKTAQFSIKEYSDKINERFELIKNEGYNNTYRIKIEGDLRRLYNECNTNINNIDGYLRKNLDKFKIKNTQEKEELISMFKKKLNRLQAQTLMKSKDEVTAKPSEKTYITSNQSEDLMAPINGSEEENSIIDDIQKEDKIIDEYLQKVMEKLEIFDANMDNISTEIGKLNKKVNKTREHSEQTMQNIEDSNEKIKELTSKFSKPGKICIYVVLLVVVLVVGCLIYNFVT